MSRILPPHPLQKLRKLIHVQVIEQQSHDCTQRFPQLVKSFFKILCAYSPIKDADSFYQGYAILNPDKLKTPRIGMDSCVLSTLNR